MQCKECTGYELDLSLTLKDILDIQIKHDKMNAQHYKEIRPCNCDICKLADIIKDIK